METRRNVLKRGAAVAGGVALQASQAAGRAEIPGSRPV